MHAKPDFIIAGAARSGTTWTYELLAKHPQIYMAKPRQPEPKFFWKDDIYNKGMKYYLDTWFEKAPKNQLWGEKSTAYLEGSSISALRMKEALPQLKLIFILRNPIDRTYSNYLWSKKHGWEKLGLEEALKKELSREKKYGAKLKYIRPFSYRSRSLYYRLLLPFYKNFKPSQILCLRFEDLLDNPKLFAKKIHAFLGVKTRPNDANGIPPINVSDAIRLPLSPSLEKKLAKSFKSENRKLKQILGRSFKIWECRT